MDYLAIYQRFIDGRRLKERELTGYRERHHIMPRSLGGGDASDNLIFLTAEDHYFAHCCLAKIYGGKMWSALFAVAHMAKSDHAAAFFGRRRMVAAARTRAAVVRSEDMKRRWADGSFHRDRRYRAWTAEEREHRSRALKGRRADPAAIRKAADARLARQPTLVFEHKMTGERIVASPFVFRKQAGVSQSLTSYLVSGKIKTAKGWRIVQPS